MANAFKLDDIRKAAEKKFGDTEIEVSDKLTVTLTNALRLPKEIRDQVVAAQEKFGTDEHETSDVLAEILRLVAKDKKDVESLLDLVGDDLAFLMSIFDHYGKESELGEA